MNSESARKYYAMCDSRVEELDLENAIHYQGWVNTKGALRNVGYALSLSDFEGMQVAPGQAFCAGGQGLFLPWRGVESCYPSEFIFSSIELMAEYILAMYRMIVFRLNVRRTMVENSCLSAMILR